MLIRCIVVGAFVLASALASAGEVGDWEHTYAQGIAHRQQGQLDLSIDLLGQAVRTARTGEERMRATGELGASLLQARRFDQAAVSLRDAHAFFSGIDRARYAIDLGNLAAARQRHKDAQRYYEEALQLAGGDRELRARIGLNLARLAPEPDKLKKLSDLFEDIGAVEDAPARARLYLNLGNQALVLGDPALVLTYRSLELARRLAMSAADARLRIEALDALAQLYENEGRISDALLLTQQALTQARDAPPGAAGDLLINLEWRQARVYKALDRRELALAAYQRAVDQIEAIRQDIPIEYEDGTSSFRRTLEPIYLGYVEGLLQASDKYAGAERAAYLRRVTNAVELIRQSEMQDYLGDRCTVDTVKGGTATVIPAATAVLYPILLTDRIELVVDTGTDIARYSTRIAGAAVRRTAALFANELREGSTNYVPRSRQLYDWLLRPLEQFFAERQIRTLVVVPDGALRLVPMGALHDGDSFAIEKLAITTIPGLSMTNTNPASGRTTRLLVAGVSEPGAVVGKLSDATVEHILGAAGTPKADRTSVASSRTLRSVRREPSADATAVPNDEAARRQALSAALALPGVKQEVEALARISRSTVMLNEPFTVDGFRRAAVSGAYSLIHVASHGVFGGTGDASYVLAYDDLLTLNGLESLLKGDQFRKNPIELLTLSACETAEGDERSPLGISGAAIKARAKSVLGTLWPVDDNAARTAMERFYRGLLAGRASKAEALRQSQIELLRSEGFAHPFFWSPFVLIGNWL